MIIAPPPNVQLPGLDLGVQPLRLKNNNQTVPDATPSSAASNGLTSCMNREYMYTFVRFPAPGAISLSALSRFVCASLRLRLFLFVQR